MTYSRLSLILAVLISLVNITHGETYRIEPGDSLSIVVLDHPSYSRPMQVRRDGSSIYLGGELHVAGKSLVEAAELVREQIRKYGRTENPIVIVDPLQGRGFLVWGAVTVPNRFPLPLHDEIGLYEALTKAGGMSGGADQENIKIIRADKSIEIYDLSSDQDYREIFIGDGDIVFVPALEVVYIHGHVKKPGQILIREKIRIDHALAMADGPLDTPDSRANLENVRIFKTNGASTELNLANPAWKNAMEDVEDGPFYLKDRDVVFVPPLAVAEVQGQVQVPGRKVYFHRRIRVDHALAQASGPDTLADLSSV
ncbi:MAG: polysaccharide biosynthesis/export family protein, partial [Candidatus Poribacteria bacterium]|nr:polysaccharide biosynthesis/export family protein [Candidatus Poribacteria bacterium]